MAEHGRLGIGGRTDWFNVVPTFDGSGPADDWLDLFNTTRQIAGWTDPEALLVLDYKLQGDARQWRKSTRTQYTTFQAVRAALRTEYPTIAVSPLTRLVQLKWEPGTSMEFHAAVHTRVPQASRAARQRGGAALGGGAVHWLLIRAIPVDCYEQQPQHTR